MITITQDKSQSITFTKLYPWIIWLLASSFLFYKYLLQVAPSIMVPELMQRFNLTAEQVGYLAACYFYSYMVMQLPAGVLLDSIRLKLLLPLAIFTCALGGYLFAIAPSFFIAELGRVLIGLGGAFSAIGTMKLISLWFPPSQFALVSGLMMTLGMLGAVGGQAPLAQAMQHYGSQQTIHACAMQGMLLALNMYVGIKEKPMKSCEPRLRFNDLQAYVKKLLINPQCWAISIFSGLAFAPISAFGGLWGVPFLALKSDLTTPQAALQISTIFIGFAFGCPLSGALSERMGKRKPLMCGGTMIGCLSLLSIIYLPIHNNLILTALLFSFGFFTSFFFISFAMIREINPIIMGGTAIGFINTFDAIFGALSEPGIGRLLDLQWNGVLHAGVRQFSLSNYQHALILLPIAMITGLIFSYFVKETECNAIDT